MRTKQSKIAPAAPEAVDTVTLLWVGPGKLATKQFNKASPDAEVTSKQFDAGYFYAVLRPIGVSCIEDLSLVLTTAEKWPQALIVRGAPVSESLIGTDVTRTGSGDGSAFKGNFMTPIQGRHYVEIDVDKLQLPTGWTLDHASIGKICEYVIQLLPAEFHDASYHWQLSSSSGVFDRTKVSAHFWFWLKRPVPDADLKSWAKHVNHAANIKLIDPALFQHVQPHYIAAPIFTGMSDPFPTRSGLISKSLGSVDLKLPPPVAVSQTGSTVNSDSFNRSGDGGFEYYLSQIGDHPGGDGFHDPIVRAAASYVAAHGTQDTDAEALFLSIQLRVIKADSSNHSRGDVEARSSRDHIMSAINTALNKYGDAVGQRRKSRRLVGLTPDAHEGYQEIAMIQASIDAILDEVF